MGCSDILILGTSKIYPNAPTIGQVIGNGRESYTRAMSGITVSDGGIV